MASSAAVSYLIEKARGQEHLSVWAPHDQPPSTFTDPSKHSNKYFQYLIRSVNTLSISSIKVYESSLQESSLQARTFSANF